MTDYVIDKWKEKYYKFHFDKQAYTKPKKRQDLYVLIFVGFSNHPSSANDLFIGFA
jgi:hypothetical protein